MKQALDLSCTQFRGPCVNEEVNKFNWQLHKKMRIFENAKVIDSVS
jgi:hypothetical protein